MNMKRKIVVGEKFKINIPEEIMKKAGIKKGDQIVFIENDDDKLEIQKA
jgi:AbrB family looped-hinge helix DNA binding protein